MPDTREPPPAVLHAARCGDFAPLMPYVQANPPSVWARIMVAMASATSPPQPAKVNGAALVDLALLLAIGDDPDGLLAIASRQNGRPDWERAIVQRWIALTTGETLPDLDAPAGDPSITATAQQALYRLEQGDVSEAKTLARRANRMARSDGLVFQEYLSSLVLARVRRYDGKPHLALRILADLARVVPQPWRGWVQWEQAFAGAELASATTRSWATLPSDLIEAARAGSRVAFDAVGTPRSHLFGKELAQLRVALDPAAALTKALEEWSLGRTDAAPAVLSGLVVPSVDEQGQERAGALVQIYPGRPARRFLSLGAALYSESGPNITFALAQSRTYHLIAELAFAQAPLAIEEIFGRVYGFAYEQGRHGSVLRMLLHRARTALPESAEIVRSDQGLELVTKSPLASPDPRCVLDMDALVLKALATRGGRASAREIAESLGVSARTVQHALRGLLDDGACEMVKVGRKVTYKLEDTTFWEPTLERLHPRGIRA